MVLDDCSADKMKYNRRCFVACLHVCVYERENVCHKDWVWCICVLVCVCVHMYVRESACGKTVWCVCERERVSGRLGLVYVCLTSRSVL